MTVYDYREITLKDDLCLEINRDTDIENPRENDCNAATFYCLKSPRRKIGDIIDSAYYLNETKRTLAKTGEYAILPIYIYEHSGIALCTVPFSDIWDSACIGFAAANINDFMKQRISDTPVSRCEATHGYVKYDKSIIVSKDETTVNRIADMLDSMGFDAVTGYFNPEYRIFRP